jgi:hypothetical protein
VLVNVILILATMAATDATFTLPRRRRHRAHDRQPPSTPTVLIFGTPARGTASAARRGIEAAVRNSYSRAGQRDPSTFANAHQRL